MKLHISLVICISLFQILIAAKYGGHELNLDENFEFGSTDKEF
jgi:hypothetical protein